MFEPAHYAPQIKQTGNKCCNIWSDRWPISITVAFLTNISGFWKNSQGLLIKEFVIGIFPEFMTTVSL